MKAESTQTKSTEPTIHSAAELFPLMEGEEFAALKADIQAHGQRQPISVVDGQILDGRNRYRACQALGRKPILESISPPKDPVAFVLSANLHRRHLTESQRAMVAGRLKVHFAPAAKERQDAGRRSGGHSRKKNLVANLPPSKQLGKAREQAAALVRVSPRSVEHATTVLTLGSPELIAAVDVGLVRVSKAAKVAKSISKVEQLDVATKPPAKKMAGRKSKSSAVTERAAEGQPSANKTPELYDLFKNLEEMMKSIYRSWPSEDRIKLASKLYDWSQELYQSKHIESMEK